MGGVQGDVNMERPLPTSQVLRLVLFAAQGRVYMVHAFSPPEAGLVSNHFYNLF